MNEINLRNCQNKNDILYYKNRLWIFVDVFLFVNLFKKIYKFLTSNYFDFNRMKNLLRRDYYWSNIRKIVRQYVRNCYKYQRIKIFKNRKNDLFIFFIIFLQRWIDISIDFITKLFKVHDYNVICTIIDRFNKKCHYVFCTTKNENTNIEIITKIFI